MLSDSRALRNGVLPFQGGAGEPCCVPGLCHGMLGAQPGAGETCHAGGCPGGRTDLHRCEAAEARRGVKVLSAEVRKGEITEYKDETCPHIPSLG